MTRRSALHRPRQKTPALFAKGGRERLAGLGVVFLDPFQLVALNLLNRQNFLTFVGQRRINMLEIAAQAAQAIGLKARGVVCPFPSAVECEMPLDPLCTKRECGHISSKTKVVPGEADVLQDVPGSGRSMPRIFLTAGISARRDVSAPCVSKNQECMDASIQLPKA